VVRVRSVYLPYPACLREAPRISHSFNALTATGRKARAFPSTTDAKGEYPPPKKKQDKNPIPACQHMEQSRVVRVTICLSSLSRHSPMTGRSARKGPALVLQTVLECSAPSTQRLRITLCLSVCMYVTKPPVPLLMSRPEHDGHSASHRHRRLLHLQYHHQGLSAGARLLHRPAHHLVSSTRRHSVGRHRDQRCAALRSLACRCPGLSVRQRNGWCLAPLPVFVSVCPAMHRPVLDLTEGCAALPSLACRCPSLSVPQRNGWYWTPLPVFVSVCPPMHRPVLDLTTRLPATW
jgi:hypothetical protein